jgi:hypothetical protein
MDLCADAVPVELDADPRFDIQQHSDKQPRDKHARETITTGATERLSSGCLERVCCSDADGPPVRKSPKRPTMNPLGRIGTLWHSIGPTTSRLFPSHCGKRYVDAEGGFEARKLDRLSPWVISRFHRNRCAILRPGSVMVQGQERGWTGAIGSSGIPFPGQADRPAFAAVERGPRRDGHRG